MADKLGGRIKHRQRMNKIKRRCDKCRKMAKDFYGEEYLCRIHSPMRDGSQEKKK